MSDNRLKQVWHSLVGGIARRQNLRRTFKTIASIPYDEWMEHGAALLDEEGGHADE